MGAIELLMLASMLVAWLALLGVAVLPALVLDARHSGEGRKVVLESQAYILSRHRG